MRVLAAVLATAILLAACASALSAPASTRSSDVASIVAPSRRAGERERVVLVVVLADALNVRRCPSTRCVPVAWLHRGDVARVLARRGRWLRIGPGWVYGEYVR